MFISDGCPEATTTVKVTNSEAIICHDIQRAHEEADQRLLFHTLYASTHERDDKIVIRSSDTDVICLSIYYAMTADIHTLSDCSDWQIPLLSTMGWISSVLVEEMSLVFCMALGKGFG